MFKYVIWYNKLKIIKKIESSSCLFNVPKDESEVGDGTDGLAERDGVMFRPCPVSWSRLSNYHKKDGKPMGANCSLPTETKLAVGGLWGGSDGWAYFDRRSRLFHEWSRREAQEEHPKNTCSSPHVKEAVGRAVMWRRSGGLIAFDRRGCRWAISLSYSTPSGIVNGFGRRFVPCVEMTSHRTPLAIRMDAYIKKGPALDFDFMC